MSLKFPETSFKAFSDEGGISLPPVTFQRSWRMASQQCQLALLSALLDAYYQGPLIFRDQAPVVVHIPTDSGSVFAATWIFAPKVWGPTVVVETETMKAFITFSALLVATSALTGKKQAGSALLRKLPVQAASSLQSSLFFLVLLLALETHT